jgi:hypothetical protein
VGRRPHAIVIDAAGIPEPEVPAIVTA